MKSSKLIEAAIVFQYFQTWNGLIFSEYGNLALLQFHPDNFKVAKRSFGVHMQQAGAVYYMLNISNKQ